MRHDVSVGDYLLERGLINRFLVDLINDLLRRPDVCGTCTQRNYEL